MSNVLELKDISKHFKQGDEQLEILKGASLAVKKGEIVAIVGASGSGKSTFLQIAGLLENPDGGEVVIDDEDCTKISDKKKTKVRKKDIGFVYQYHHLLQEFSALENVMLPQMINGKSSKKAKERAEELLQKLGLKDRAKHLPSELSGGEQQRVAIARAIANEPKILLADEPTGNLDPETSDKVFDILLEQIKKEKLSLLLVTHNMELAKRADKVFKFENRKLVEA